MRGSDGRIFERIGDGAYAAFDDARAAMAAAAQLQARMTAADWGAVGRVRVRIAMVTGDVEVRDSRFYGRPLFRAARLQALAGGGETLLSTTAVAEAGRRTPAGPL